MSRDDVVLDASAVVEMLLGQAPFARAQVGRRRAHAPAHLDAEVLLVLGRLHRSGALDAAQVDDAVAALAAAPIERHALPGMLAGAWARQDQVRPADALYLELAERLDCELLTADDRLAGARSDVEVLTPRRR